MLQGFQNTLLFASLIFTTTKIILFYNSRHGSFKMFHVMMNIFSKAQILNFLLDRERKTLTLRLKFLTKTSKTIQLNSIALVKSIFGRFIKKNFLSFPGCSSFNTSVKSHHILAHKRYACISFIYQLTA